MYCGGQCLNGGYHTMGVICQALPVQGNNTITCPSMLLCISVMWARAISNLALAVTSF